VFAFIHIPKTAGSTISSILRQSYRTKHCDIRLGNDFAEPVLTASTLRRTRMIHWRLKSIAGHGVVPYSDLETLCPDLRYYTFVREPLSRCASEYQFLVQRDGLTASFDEWIASDAARNRITKKLGGTDDSASAIEVLRRRVDYVGVVERFNESLVMWQRWCGDPDLEIRHRPKNVMRQTSIKDNLLRDPVSHSALLAANQEDLEVYRYVLQEILPKQLSQYGPALEADVRAFQATNRPPRPCPGQLTSLLVRELLYKPLSKRLARN
jgi:hypothetical protein